MIIPGQFGFNCPSGYREEAFSDFSHRVQCLTKSCCSRHLPFYIGTKNLKFVEDHPRNIPAKFGSNWPSVLSKEK